ncbi:tetratricopeptide repeat protein [Vibrio sonorensis]|uniref:tetratricopeptide repeat protein n=1 Tax=Vibrio sonorensis TaxID=1004316 RepID=UPI0024805174|nr:tetratricopeptide repeat protein [Vibrio sonorensis]
MTRDIHKLEKAVEVYPGNHTAWLSLSKAYHLGAHDNEAAIESMTHFLTLNPNHIHGRYYISDLMIKQGRCEEAIVILDSLLRHYPTFERAEGLMYRGYDCRRQKLNVQ